MGITRSTALEIYTNPGDLEITVGQEEESGKFAIGIYRGPGHNFKLMISSVPFAESLEDAIEVIRKEVLELSMHAIEKDLEDPESFISQYLNPDGAEIDQSKVLNPGLISRILDELRQHRIASTYKMLESAG